MRRPYWLALLILLSAGLAASPALAQTPTPNEINEIARELWCPLCNGVRLDNCDLQACIQMREVIAQKLEAKESKEQIKAYFVEQYGDVVLGAPAAEGFNLVAYLLPVLAAVVGIGWLIFFVRARSRPRPAPAREAGRPDGEADEYIRRVDEELQHYD